MLSAERSTLSGTVSRCSLFVMDRTTSFSDSICCTLMVVMTSMPASSRSTTSCQRFSCVHPGMFVWASSSTRATCGRRAMTANRSISLNHMPRYFIQRRGTVSRPLAAFCVALRPWVSNRAMTTSLPSSTSRLPSDSIAYVLPTPGAAPSRTLSVPRFVTAIFPPFRSSAACHTFRGLKPDGCGTAAHDGAASVRDVLHLRIIPVFWPDDI